MCLRSFGTDMNVKSESMSNIRVSIHVEETTYDLPTPMAHGW